MTILNQRWMFPQLETDKIYDMGIDATINDWIHPILWLPHIFEQLFEYHGFLTEV